MSSLILSGLLCILNIVSAVVISASLFTAWVLKVDSRIELSFLAFISMWFVYIIGSAILIGIGLLSAIFVWPSILLWIGAYFTFKYYRDKASSL